jgi:hypothetical protein
MLDHDSALIEQLDTEDPPSAKDLTELDRLADEHDTQALAATSENPTLTQIFSPLSPSVLEGIDLSFLVGDSSSGTVEPARGSPSGSR